MDVVSLRKEITNWAHMGITYTAWAAMALGFINEIIRDASSQAGLPPSISGYLVVVGGSIGSASKLIDSIHSALTARFLGTAMTASTPSPSTAAAGSTTATPEPGTVSSQL